MPVLSNFSRELRDFSFSVDYKSESDWRWWSDKDTWVPKGHSQFALALHSLSTPSLPLHHLGLLSLSGGSDPSRTGAWPQWYFSPRLFPAGPAPSAHAPFILPHLHWWVFFLHRSAPTCVCVCVSLSRALSLLIPSFLRWPQLPEPLYDKQFLLGHL